MTNFLKRSLRLLLEMDGVGGCARHGRSEKSRGMVGDRNLSWAASVGMERESGHPQRGTNKIWWTGIRCDSQIKLVRETTPF